MSTNMQNQEPLTMPEEVNAEFISDLMGRLVGSTIVAIFPYSPTEFYIGTERDGVATQVLLTSENGEMVISEGTMETQK